MDQRLKRQSEKHKEVKAKPTLNKNTAGIGTNKIHAVQSGKKKSGCCCEGTGLCHARNGTRRAVTEGFSK